MRMVSVPLVLTALVALGGCQVVPINSMTSEVDVFSNETVVTSNLNCGNSFCTRFKMTEDSAVVFVGYQGDGWLFLDKIMMKIEGSEDTIVLEGDFFRETVYGGIVRETLTAPIDAELFDFFESSLGKKVYVRMQGDQYYKDVDFTVRNDKAGQWFLFVEEYKSMNSDPSETPGANF